MLELHQNPSAPTQVFFCMKCAMLFVAQGVNTQTCPMCSQGTLTSLAKEEASTMIHPTDQYCTKCKRVLSTADTDAVCLDTERSHTRQPIPKEITSWLTEGA